MKGYAMNSGSMLAGWNFSNLKDGVFSESFQKHRETVLVCCNILQHTRTVSLCFTAVL